MRIFFILTGLLFFTKAIGQRVDDLDQHRIDTLSLKGIVAQNVIVFTNQELEFVLDYRIFKDSALFFAKDYRKTDKTQVKKVAALLKKAKKQLRSGDTARMKAEDYHLIGFYFVEKFITSRIDTGEIVIRDVASGESLSKVVRIKGSYINGPLDAWGGRRYYKLGSKRHFASVTTSQS